MGVILFQIWTKCALMYPARNKCSAPGICFDKLNTRMRTLGGGRKKGHSLQVCAKTQAGWRHRSRALGRTTCMGTQSGEEIVNHPPNRLSPLKRARRACQGREGGGKGVGKAGWQSRTSYLSPGSDLRVISCLSKER